MLVLVNTGAKCKRLHWCWCRFWCMRVQQAVGGKVRLRVAPILAGRKARDSIDGYLMSAG